MRLIRYVCLFVVLLVTTPLLLWMGRMVSAQSPQASARRRAGLSTPVPKPVPARRPVRVPVRAQDVTIATNRADDVIQRVIWQKSPIKQGDVVDYTVVLRKIATTNTVFRVELFKTTQDGAIVSPAVYSAPQTLPANQRRFRYEITQPLGVGFYLLRVARLWGTESHETVFEVNTTGSLLRSSEYRVAAVYTPVTKLRVDNPTAAAVDDDDDRNVVFRAATTATGEAEVALLGDRLTPGQEVFVEVTTRRIVKTDSSTLDLNVTLMLYTEKGKPAWPSSITRTLNVNNKQHTFSFRATENGKLGGANLTKGIYLLTAVREGKMDDEPQGPASIELDVRP